MPVTASAGTAWSDNSWTWFMEQSFFTSWNYENPKRKLLRLTVWQLPSYRMQLLLVNSLGPILIQKPKVKPKITKPLYKNEDLCEQIFNWWCFALKLTSNRGFLPALSMKNAPMPVTTTYKTDLCEDVYIRNSHYRLHGVGKVSEN